MQILSETHLFLGLTCVIQALAKQSLKHTWLANILTYCDSAFHKPFACLRSVVSLHSPTKHVAGGNVLKTKIQDTRRANIIFFISSLQLASTNFLIDRKSPFFLGLPLSLLCDFYSLEPRLKHLMCSKLGSRSLGVGKCSSSKRVAQRSRRA